MSNALKRFTRDVFFIVFASMLALPASAGFINFITYIDGAQANAGLGTGSSGTGTGFIMLNEVNNKLSWMISWQDLDGDVLSAHFHGPALHNQNSGVQVGIDVGSNPAMNSALLTSTQIDDLFAGLWYINIHTTAVPAGEIRGNIPGVDVPEPGILGLLCVGLLGLNLARRLKNTL